MPKSKLKPSATKKKSTLRPQALSVPFERPPKSVPVSKSKATLRPTTPSKYQQRQEFDDSWASQRKIMKEFCEEKTSSEKSSVYSFGNLSRVSPKKSVFRQVNSVARDCNLSTQGVLRDQRQKSAKVDTSPFLSPYVIQSSPKEDKTRRVPKLQ